MDSADEEALLRRVRGTIPIECGYALRTAETLRSMLARPPLTRALGAYNGQQAVQYVKAGLRAVYLSGWQVAAANNTAHEVYPDQSLYPVDSMPVLVGEIVRALRRADQIQGLTDPPTPIRYEVPLIADGEAGFGGPLHAYELTRRLIEAGAAAVHFEDQSPSAKKCGHLGGKVLLPISQMIRNLVAARWAARVMGTTTVIIARTDAESAELLVSDQDPRDASFIDRSVPRTPDGFFRFRAGLDACIHRALAYAPYADMLWFETAVPSIEDAERFARSIHERFPGKWLAYNCSPSCRWRAHFSRDEELRGFHERLSDLGYVFQFITLAGYHATNEAAFRLASGYKQDGMLAYARLQENELALGRGSTYTGVKHQTEAGVTYFDTISRLIDAETSTTSFEGSTESSQFS